MIPDDDNRHDYSESNDQLLFLDDEDGKEDVEEEEEEEDDLDLMLPAAAIHPASNTGSSSGEYTNETLRTRTSRWYREEIQRVYMQQQPPHGNPFYKEILKNIPSYLVPQHSVTYVRYVVWLLLHGV